jgi:hypothetical protein
MQYYLPLLDTLKLEICVVKTLVFNVSNGQLEVLKGF